MGRNFYDRPVPRHDLCILGHDLCIHQYRHRRVDPHLRHADFRGADVHLRPIGQKMRLALASGFCPAHLYAGVDGAVHPVDLCARVKEVFHL